MKRLWIWTGLAVLIGMAGCSPSQPKDSQNGPNPLPQSTNYVDTAHICSQTFTREIISNGTVQAAKQAKLAFATGGELIRVQVHNGQQVTQGQVLALLDTTALRERLQKARQGVRKAKIAFRNLLIGQGYSPEDTSAVPGDFLRIAKLESGMQQARLEIRKARRQLKQAVLKAPFGGRVANMAFKPHEQISAGKTFCSLLADKVYQVDFKVLETELDAIHIRQPLKVQPLAGGSAKGRITAINPQVDEHGMVQVTARIQSGSQRLMDGMHVKVHVQQPLPGKLVIPKSALVLRQNKEVVFTLKNDSIAMWNYVKTGHENSQAYTITEGLNPGDAVITTGNINLAHETIVEVKK